MYIHTIYDPFVWESYSILILWLRVTHLASPILASVLSLYNIGIIMLVVPNYCSEVPLVHKKVLPPNQRLRIFSLTFWYYALTIDIEFDITWREQFKFVEDVCEIYREIWKITICDHLLWWIPQ